MKNTKFALIASFMGLLLCVALLFGATYAWFSTTVTTAPNVVRTGTFNVTIEFSEDGSTWAPLTNTSKLFNEVTLLPGTNAVRYVRVTNGNDYAVNASLSLGGMTVTDNSTELQFAYKTVTSAPAAFADLENGTALNGVTTVLNSEEIAANGSVIVALGISLPKSATATGIEATFTITVGATQQTA